MLKMILNLNKNVLARTFCCSRLVLFNSRNCIISFLFLTSILLISVILLPGCGGDQASGNNNDRGKSEGDNSKIAAAIPVQVAAVKRDSISLSP